MDEIRAIDIKISMTKSKVKIKALKVEKARLLKQLQAKNPTLTKKQLATMVLLYIASPRPRMRVKRPSDKKVKKPSDKGVMEEIKQQRKDATQKHKNLVKEREKIKHRIKILMGQKTGIRIASKEIERLRVKINQLNKQIARAAMRMANLQRMALKIKQKVKQKIRQKTRRRAKARRKIKKTKKMQIPMIVLPPVPVIPKKTKVKPKKKMVMTDAQYRGWFIKNSIPTLKSLYGW